MSVKGLAAVSITTGTSEQKLVYQTSQTISDTTFKPSMQCGFLSNHQAKYASADCLTGQEPANTSWASGTGAGLTQKKPQITEKNIFQCDFTKQTDSHVLFEQFKEERQHSWLHLSCQSHQ